MAIPVDTFTNVVEQQNLSLTSIATALNNSAQSHILFQEAIRYSNTFPTTLSSFANDKNYQTLAEVNEIITDAIGINPSVTTTIPQLQAQLDNNTSATSAILNQLVLKVDKVNGKDLSTNDFTTSEKQKLGSIANQATKNETDSYLLNRSNHGGTQGITTITNLQTTLDSKVDKVDGKGLSTNDLTIILKTQYDAAYTHSQITAGNPHGTTKSDIGLGNVDNTTDLGKPISNATQTALDAKANTTDVYIKSEIDAKLQVKANSSAVMYKAQNLADLTDISTARTNLGVYSKSETDSLVQGDLKYLTVSTINANTTLTEASSSVLICTNTTNGITITLPLAKLQNKGLNFVIKRFGFGGVVVETQGGQKLDDGTTYEITPKNNSITFISDGSNWFII
jgi:hypothetical protein